MRQNLTNIPTVDINNVDHLYIVGSTTKSGLLEGRSNVKVDLKAAIGEGGEGGSSEAQEVFDALFGQTPYFAVPDGDSGVTAKTLKQLLSLSFEDEESVSVPAFYKEKLPLPRVYLAFYESFDGETEFNLRVADKDAYIIMAPVPEEYISGGPWYYPNPCEQGTIDLTSFPYPDFGGSTVLTGIEIPENENQITIAYISPIGFGTKTLNRTGTGYGSGGVWIDKVDGVWVWTEGAA